MCLRCVCLMETKQVHSVLQQDIVYLTSAAPMEFFKEQRFVEINDDIMPVQSVGCS